MTTRREITVIQSSVILISTIIGVGVLALPRFAAKAGGSAAPLLTCIGVGIAFVGLLLLAILGKRFPNQSIIQYSRTLIGKRMGSIVGLLILGFFATLTAFGAREFGEVVNTSVLQRTPLSVTVMTMLVLAAVSTRNDITTFAHMHAFYIPFVYFPGVLIVAFSLKNAHFIYLQPMIGNGMHDPFWGTLTIAALFQGSFVLTIVIPSMRHPEKVVKASVWAMFLAGGLYIAIVVACMAVFGSEETKLALFPTLELAKFTLLPGEILERLDAVFLIVWVTAVFTTLLSTYFLTVYGLTELFGLKDHKMFSLFILPFLFIIAVLPPNTVEMYKMIELVGRIGLCLTILFPALLLAVAIIRKKDGRHEPLS